ncbi:hypothetical protein PVK06_017713 [Gossypium arboreum]|uniref:Reverse transcriptase n=1 Tax=Gossypium arboreum TaxID=29729 RepID=A0ABR0Q3I4_GOSAR|nr:hypothetical protein PVK06_017713 [Gossypium arboreum]
MFKIASDFFGKLFSTSDLGSDEHVFGLVEKRVNDNMNDFLLQQFTEEDIIHAVKTMTPLKASGIDGFSAIFFQRYWHIFGSDISRYCLSVLNEGFSTLINEAKQKGLMRRAFVGRERFSINHLFFVDDCILFGGTSKEGENVVQEITNEYKVISGQRVNSEKSLIYFGANVYKNVKDTITNTLGVRAASNPEKYLGLPMMVLTLRLPGGAFAVLGILLQTEFCGESTNSILSIPLFEARSEDMLVWKYDGSGDYSVRSGYQVRALIVLTVWPIAERSFLCFLVVILSATLSRVMN